MTAPAGQNPMEFGTHLVSNSAESLSDAEKLDVIYQRVEWLYVTVGGLLETMQANPMARMMMGRKK